jgi:tRNA G46 methylase TrmB
MPEFVVEYGRTTAPAQADGRLDSPAFHRNHEPIWTAISGFLTAQSGDLLEVGSGTGQHAAAFARRAP